MQFLDPAEKGVYENGLKLSIVFSPLKRSGSNTSGLECTLGLLNITKKFIVNVESAGTIRPSSSFISSSIFLPITGTGGYRRNDSLITSSRYLKL